MNANAHHDEIDNTIDRALTALRDAQPRSGLENRILASVEHRTTALGGPSFRKPGSPASVLCSLGWKAKGWGIARGSARENLGWTAHLALWTATSAAILAIASLIILHQGSFRPATQTVTLSHQSNAVILSERSESKKPDAARAATNPEPFSTTNLAQTTQTVSSRPERAARSGETPVFRNCPDHLASGCTIHDDGAAVGMGGLTTTPTDAQALADLHAPSHPAPPLPLTPEEKLLLRMLRYGDATQLAELNPLVRAQHDADETAAFKAFFPDPPPVQQPGDTE